MQLATQRNITLREGCLRLLSRGFAPPGEVASRDAFLQAGLILDELGLDGLAFASSLWRWLDRLDGVNWASLGMDYVRLFESASDGSMCRPLESDHLGDPMLGDSGLLAARADAALMRYGGRADDGRPADHLGWQLELGARMCAHQHMAFESDRDEEAYPILVELRALLTRLDRWVPTVARALDAHDRVGVYRLLGHAAADFVSHEADVMRRLCVDMGLS